MSHMDCSKPSRTVRATVLLFFYSIIALGPVAPVILHFSPVAHAVTGQCTGDCIVDGCDPERSANRACCCWQRPPLTAAPEALVTTDCCETTPARQAPTQPSCCPGPAQPEAPSCCQSAVSHPGDRDDRDTRPLTVFRCGCPCSGDIPMYSCLGKIDLVPTQFFVLMVAGQDAVHVDGLPVQLCSHIVSPPTPPPECHSVA